MRKNFYTKIQQNTGSSFVEILISIIILSLVGLSVTNSISTSDVQKNNLNIKTKGMIALTSAAEILSATPYTFCSSTVATPSTYINALASLNNSLNRNTFAANERVIVEIDDVDARSDDGVSVITRSNDQEVSFTYCKDLMVNQNQFNDVYWGIQKITIKFTRYIPNQAGNIQTVLETGYRTIMKTFDNKDTNYSASGTFRTLSQEVNCSDLSPVPSTSSSSITTAIIQIEQERCFKFAVQVQGTTTTRTDFLFSIINANPSSTDVITSWVSPNANVLRVWAPQFKTDISTTRNPPGKINIDVAAFSTDVAAMAVPSALSLTINAMKVTDWFSNLDLNSTDLITPRTVLNSFVSGWTDKSFVNGNLVPNFNPVIPFGGLLNANNNYSYSITPNSGSLSFLTLTGLNFDASTGVISGTACGKEQSFSYAFSVADANVSRATNSITIQLTGFGIKTIGSLNSSYQKSTSSTTRSLRIELVQACGGIGPYIFSATAPLPGGISLNPSSTNPAIGVLSGNLPTGTGTYTFKVKVTDSSSPSVSTTTTQSFTLRITN
jgi:hypothetical protein